MSEFRFLGKKGSLPTKELDTFEAPEGCGIVELTSDEVTALCPVTGQPDQYTVTIRYAPWQSCIESKSLKLYFQSYREEGVFCEAFCAKIAKDVFEQIKPLWAEVIVVQKPRGGISIHATSVMEAEEPDDQLRFQLGDGAK